LDKFRDTFVKSGSSQFGSEQTHKDLDLRILQEINGCFYKDTEAFYEKYFEGKRWSTEVGQIAQKVNPQMDDGRWKEYPQIPTQDIVLDWLGIWIQYGICVKDYGLTSRTTSGNPRKMRSTRAAQESRHPRSRRE
jgi:hypothetical protein